MKLPKIPIDYNMAETGEEPFDGEVAILHAQYGLTFGRYYKDFACWYTDVGPVPVDRITHYTPMPEFEEITK